MTKQTATSIIADLMNRAEPMTSFEGNSLDNTGFLKTFLTMSQIKVLVGENPEYRDTGKHAVYNFTVNGRRFTLDVTITKANRRPVKFSYDWRTPEQETYELEAEREVIMDRLEAPRTSETLPRRDVDQLRVQLITNRLYELHQMKSALAESYPGEFVDSEPETDIGPDEEHKSSQEDAWFKAYGMEKNFSNAVMAAAENDDIDKELAEEYGIALEDETSEDLPQVTEAELLSSGHFTGITAAKMAELNIADMETKLAEIQTQPARKVYPVDKPTEDSSHDDVASYYESLWYLLNPSWPLPANWWNTSKIYLLDQIEIMEANLAKRHLEAKNPTPKTHVIRSEKTLRAHLRAAEGLLMKSIHSQVEVTISNDMENSPAQVRSITVYIRAKSSDWSPYYQYRKGSFSEETPNVSASSRKDLIKIISIYLHLSK